MWCCERVMGRVAGWRTRVVGKKPVQGGRSGCPVSLVGLACRLWQLRGAMISSDSVGVANWRDCSMPAGLPPVLRSVPVGEGCDLFHAIVCCLFEFWRPKCRVRSLLLWHVSERVGLGGIGAADHTGLDVTCVLPAVSGDVM